MRKYLKFEDIIAGLKKGYEIFTDRGAGGAPYTPLFFELWNCDKKIGDIHRQTIKKLISNKIISGNKSQFDKYKYQKNPALKSAHFSAKREKKQLFENNDLINQILKIAYKAVPEKCALNGDKLIAVHSELDKFLKDKLLKRSNVRGSLPILKKLKNRIEIYDLEDLDAASWAREEGIVISVNEAKQILNAIRNYK